MFLPGIARPGLAPDPSSAAACRHAGLAAHCRHRHPPPARMRCSVPGAARLADESVEGLRPVHLGIIPKVDRAPRQAVGEDQADRAFRRSTTLAALVATHLGAAPKHYFVDRGVEVLYG
ncbi:MAG: hypothetical protein M9884_13385 [Rhodocyclaceae bacterium]|nr:hypothetical protein [Rhodocyclaceae bacterium]